MSSTMKSHGNFLVLVSIVVGFAWLVLLNRTSGIAHPASGFVPAAVPAAQPMEEVADNRAPDRVAILGTIDSLTKAFSKGDAKAVAAHWTTEGEYVSEDGTKFQGRATLEQAYENFFTKSHENMMEVEVESVRFPSRETAVVEGHFKLHTGKKRALVVSKCSFLYTREDGKWLIAIAREWPSDGLEVRNLEWLIGTWEAKRDGTIVTTTYEWNTNKTFIRSHFSITEDGQTVTGIQIIGRMPSTGGLHIWTFEDKGGIGDADITRDEKKWYFAARGSTADGQVITATNIMTPVDTDSFLWQTVERMVDGAVLPDMAPVKATRVKAKK